MSDAPRKPAPASAIARGVETVQPSLGLFDPERDHVRMVMRDIVVEVSIGLHPWEQLRPQRLVVKVPSGPSLVVIGPTTGTR